MKNHILNIGAMICAAIMLSVAIAGCSKLKAGDTFTATTDGVVFQYEVIMSRMNYVRVVPVSGNLHGTVTIPSVVSYDGDNFIVTQIGENAFRGCTSITSIYLPRTLSVIEAFAFAGCTSLQSINTPQPLSVIGDYAFDGCISLKEFSLDASISTLGKGCFRGCGALAEVKFPSSFSEIPDEAFYGCIGLGEIRLPSTVMHIGRDAFGRCHGVREIYLDRSVAMIGDGAFAECSRVEAITCLTATPPVCSVGTFAGIRTDIPVTVMMSSLQNYRIAPGWNRFINFTGRY